MTDQTTAELPGQPDGIEDDSRDLPDPHRAADRVGDYIRATGDGLYDTVYGAPLYARDLEAIVRAVDQLADAYAAGARSATEATNLREQLDRANTGRQQLAAELAAITAQRDRLVLDLGNMRGIAQGNKRHVATLTAIVERITATVGRLHHEGLATVHTEELRQALNAPVVIPAESPVPSRRAQDTVGLDWHGLRSTVEHAIHTRLTAAWPGLAEADMVFMEQVSAEAARGALGVPQLQIAAAAPWELTSAEWAVIRTAIAWRHLEGSDAAVDRALIEAVDALPHTGEISAPKLAQGGIVKPGGPVLVRESRTGCLMPSPSTLATLADVETAIAGAVQQMRDLIAERPRLEAGGIGFQAERADNLRTYGDDAPGTLRSRP